MPEELDKEEVLLTEKSLSVLKEGEQLLTQKSSVEPNKESISHTKKSLEIMTKTEILASEKSIDVSIPPEIPPEKSSCMSKKDILLSEMLSDVSAKEDTLQLEKSLDVSTTEHILLPQKTLKPKNSLDVSSKAGTPEYENSSKAEILEYKKTSEPSNKAKTPESNMSADVANKAKTPEYNMSSDVSNKAKIPESNMSSDVSNKTKTTESNMSSDVSNKAETPVLKNLKRKHRKITTTSNDTVMDVFDKAITICIEDEESDEDDAGKQKQNCNEQVQRSKRSFKEIIELRKKIGNTEFKSDEKAVNVESEKRKKDRDVQLITLSNDNLSQECIKTKSGKKNTCKNQSAESNLDEDDDHSIDNIIPSIQSDPVLHQHQKNVSRQYQGFPRPVDSHDEDAIAAARLMTDMASCRNISYLPHSNGAETHVTNSRYGYCSSVDHSEVYTRPSYHGNYPLQAMYGQSPSNTWQPNMLGQPSHDPYGQWEGNFQNIAMYDSNNNIINQGHPSFQSPENAPYGNVGMPVRMSGSNTSQHRMSYQFDDDAKMPPDYRNFHPLPMGVPLDYSVPRVGMSGQNISFQEVGNVPMDCRRQVRKIILLDQKHGKRNFEDDGSSPTKRRKRSRQQQIPQDSVANYDEIVKNLFVPAPPSKTVLIHPKFISKDRGSKVDVDPTHVRSISHRGLIRKYIDYLLMENEYITEISKAVSLPMDNCVMDDPYLMDVIRVKIPFPTPKYMQFLKDFYPAIQVDWKALNHQLDKYRSGGDGAEKFHSYYLDNRAVPVLLGEAFYFFQREGDRKVMEEKKKC
ncbi:unnamed protein product [Mytilus coruscus]|nr:unnamed protein product [Mytilus coruscus]